MFILFNDFSDVRKHFPDAADNDFDNIKPYLKRAVRKILTVIPSDLLEKAKQHFESKNTEEDNEDNQDPAVEQTTPSEDTLDELVYLLQACLVFYAYWLRLPLNNATLTESGLIQEWSDKNRAMRTEDAKEYRSSVLYLFHESVEALIEFLNKESDSFNEWKDSEFAKKTKTTVFSSASDFSEIVPIDDSARFFFLLAPAINYANRMLLNTYPEIVASLIIQAHSKNIEDDKELQLAKEFVANQAMSISINKLSEDDFPKSIHAISKTAESRDMLASSYKRTANTAWQQFDLLITPPPIPSAKSTSIVNTNKGFSV